MTLEEKDSSSERRVYLLHLDIMCSHGSISIIFDREGTTAKWISNLSPLKR